LSQGFHGVLYILDAHCKQFVLFEAIYSPYELIASLSSHKSWDTQSESAQGEAAAGAMAGRGRGAMRGRGGRGMRRR
jgi:hypothetical protein